MLDQALHTLLLKKELRHVEPLLRASTTLRELQLRGRSALSDDLKALGLRIGDRLKLVNAVEHAGVSTQKADPDDEAHAMPTPASTRATADVTSTQIPVTIEQPLPPTATTGEDEQRTISELRELPAPTGIKRHRGQSHYAAAYAEMFGYDTSRLGEVHSFKAHLGLPWKTLHGSVANSTSPLSRWQPTDAKPLPLPADSDSRHGPRLAVACMLRAAPLAAVDGFCRYYHAIGFEMVVLCFDKPSEDREAIELAQHHADECGGITIHECDEAWWAEERRVGHSFVRARAYEQMSSRLAVQRRIRQAEGWPNAEPEPDVRANLFQWHGDYNTIELFDKTDDVQTRQQLVMSRVARELWSSGYDWMLQLDIDEVTTRPRALERAPPAPPPSN